MLFDGNILLKRLKTQDTLLKFYLNTTGKKRILNDNIIAMDDRGYKIFILYRKCKTGNR